MTAKFKWGIFSNNRARAVKPVSHDSGQDGEYNGVDLGEIFHIFAQYDAFFFGAVSFDWTQQVSLHCP